jgi:hypothetical protein
VSGRGMCCSGKHGAEVQLSPNGILERPIFDSIVALPSEPVLNGDETGSRTNGDKRWVWVLCSPWFVFYHIAWECGCRVVH